MVIEKDFCHGIMLPDSILFFFITGALHENKTLFPKSLGVYVLPEVMILPSDMTITSTIIN